MPLDSDVGLLGTGIAPLIAASELLNQGKSVLLLNPDWDFFTENSELSLDPLLPLTSGNLNPRRIARSIGETVVDQLSPQFPGAIETWPPRSGQAGGRGGYRVSYAPHVRERARLWTSSFSGLGQFDWEDLENAYVETSDVGLNPQFLEGFLSVGRFPGFDRRTSQDSDAWTEEWQGYRGLLIPRLADVDVDRYRNGLLEYVRERLGSEHVICPATQIELIPGGVKFHYRGAPTTARFRDGLFVFWTPRLTQWLLSHLHLKLEQECAKPKGVRHWEEWSLISRDPLDPGVVGTFEDMTVWAEVEGAPPALPILNRLAVLKPGPLLDLNEVKRTNVGTAWASGESFHKIAKLCHDFLQWDKFTIRAMRTHAILEWGLDLDKVAGGGSCLRDSLRVKIVTHSDGPLFEIARAVRLACAAGGEA